MSGVLGTEGPENYPVSLSERKMHLEIPKRISLEQTNINEHSILTGPNYVTNTTWRFTNTTFQMQGGVFFPKNFS